MYMWGGMVYTCMCMYVWYVCAYVCGMCGVCVVYVTNVCGMSGVYVWCVRVCVMCGLMWYGVYVRSEERRVGKEC